MPVFDKRAAALMLTGTLWCCGIVRSSSEPPFPAEFTDPPEARFVVSKDPYHGSLQAAALELLLFEKRAFTVNHFCVVGYRGDGYKNAWVHWKEQQRLLLWRASDDEKMRVKGLVQARRDLKLGRDTVETEDDIKGSTYLTTRAWWQAVVNDCEAHGEQLTMQVTERSSRLATPLSASQNLIIENTSITAGEFWDAYTSELHEQRQRAQLYLIGVLDATEGVYWCDYRQFKSVTLAETIFSEFEDLDVTRRGERASKSIVEVLAKNFPCARQQ